jgi:putative mRNA 3-end processing factor
MKKSYPIDVSPSGAVLLGSRISCDGFHRDFIARVQTHVHLDHMDSFATSKGLQDIFLSEPTRDLLISEFDAELPYRENIHTLTLGKPYPVGEEQLTLLSSGHMLGSVQVAVQLLDGMRLGYSGDFQWPLSDVIQVEALVVDSTYGSPDRKREYTQDEVGTRFLELVFSMLKRGPVHIKAHRGTLQRAIQILTGQLDCPLLGSARLCSEIGVYRNHGYGIAPICLVGSPDGRSVLKTGRFIRFYGTGDEPPADTVAGTTITLSAYMAKPDDPVMVYSERSFSVALSNHADFVGTLDYIRATGARYVVTDNTRGGHGAELAEQISHQLGIVARPSTVAWSREWGV